MTPGSSDFFLNFSLEKIAFSLKYFLQYTYIYNPDTIFVIDGWSKIPKQLIKNTVHPDSVGKSFIVTAETRFIDGDRERFVQLCEELREVREVHLFKYIAKVEWLIWLQASAGANVAVLREHATNFSIKVVQVLDLKYNRPITIIFGGYGMGKTTLLRRIAQDLRAQNEKQFILYIDDIKLRQFYNSSSATNIVSFIKFFAIDLTNPDVHIMYDNFERLKERDVIIDIMRDIHLKYRHVKQWITCSELKCRNNLESKLGALSCIISPVSKKCQISYLKHIWKIDHDKFNDSIESILENCNKWNCNNTFKLGNSNYLINFTAYPLHLRMIASAFTPDQLEYQNINNANLDVYEAFVKSIYTNKNIEEAAVVKLFENFNHEFKFKTEMNLTPETFDFVNVINYLAAKWFSKNFHKYRAELIFLILRRCSSTQTFLFFFNRFLCQGKPLHTAVLSQSWDVSELCSNVNERDSGGRTALHLAECERVVSTLVANGASLEVEDDVLQWTPLQYYDFNTSLFCVESLLQHGANADKLICTLSSGEKSVSTRLEFAIAAPFINYVKFICQNVKQLNISPMTVGTLFLKDTTPDFKTMVLKRAKKSSKFYVDSFGETALFHAVKDKHFDAVRILIETLGFNINHKCNRRMTVFHIACQMNCIDIAKYLLDHGADINATYGDKNESAFTDCCKNENLQLMKFLVENGADANVILPSGKTPLELACEVGSYDIVFYLVQNVVKLNITYNIDYENLLYLAVTSASVPLVEFLLSMNRITNINRRFLLQRSVLHAACGIRRGYDTRIVSWLIQAGADVNATDNEGATPVFEIFDGMDSVDAIEVLAENGCNLSHYNDMGLTRLHMLVYNCPSISSHFDEYHSLTNLIRRLVTYGADVNARNSSGDTPLHFACRGGIIDVVRCLVSQGADIHAVNNSGETPLHLACAAEDTYQNTERNVIIFLVSKGADVNARTNSGSTPIWYALSCPTNIKGLINLGADLHSTDNNFRTMVHCFAEQNLLEKLKILKNEGMNDAKSVDSFGQTPLHAAAKNRNVCCFDYLLKFFETDVKIVDNNGLTAYDVMNADISYECDNEVDET